MGVSSEQSSLNMNRFVVALALLACAHGAPTYGVAPVAAGYGHVAGISHAGSAAYAAGPAIAQGAAYAAGPAVASGPAVSSVAHVGQTHQTYAAGPPVVQERVEYGVVGSQVVQTGQVSVVGGHQHVQSGQEVIPQPASSYLAGAPQNLVETRPLPPPVIPAPVRTHTRITPQQTNIIPQLNVQNYNVDVPVHVPVPVEREVIVNKHVPAPYEVAVPRAVPVPAPYKVHPVQEVVEQPHIHHATVTTQPLFTPLSIVPCMLSRPTLNTESLMYQLSLMLLATLLPPLLLESQVMLLPLLLLESLVLPTLVTIIKLEKISFSDIWLCLPS